VHQGCKSGQISKGSDVSTHRISVLDGWRGVAILAVLLGHFVPGFGVGTAYNAGRAGVELFFALSGVLIGQILFVDRLNLLDFAVRRFSRVVPSMWVFIAVVAPFTVISASNLIQDVLGFANVANNPVSMGHLWSVAAELQGYVCLGFLCWLGRKYSFRMTSVMAVVIAVVWVCIFSAALRGADDYYSTYWRFPYRFTAMFAAAILGFTATSQGHLFAVLPVCDRHGSHTAIQCGARLRQVHAGLVEHCCGMCWHDRRCPASRGRSGA
jgi:peptidoglycan/LPS O-acetylase OafA/YrhL